MRGVGDAGMGNHSRRLRRAEERRRAKDLIRSGVLDQVGTIGDTSGQLIAAGGDQEQTGLESGFIGTRVYPSFATTEDVAGIFQVHPKTVERWRKRHKLPCLIVGGSVRYDLSDVLRWASARKEGI